MGHRYRTPNAVPVMSQICWCKIFNMSAGDMIQDGRHTLQWASKIKRYFSLFMSEHASRCKYNVFLVRQFNFASTTVCGLRGYRKKVFGGPALHWESIHHQVSYEDLCSKATPIWHLFAL